VLSVGKSSEKLHALKYLGDPQLASKDLPSALRAIGSALSDSSDEIAVAAIGAFAAIVPEEDAYFSAVGPLIDCDKIQRVCAAIEGLHRFRSPRVFATLERKITSGPNAVRLAVLKTLEAIGTDDVILPLLAALEHAQPMVRARAGEVLKSLSLAGKLDLARAVVWLLSSRDSNVRKIAFELATTVPDRNALWTRMLVHMREQDWWARERTVDSLVELAGKTLTPVLVPYLADPSDLVRRCVLDALRRLKDPQAIGALVRVACADPDWWAREKALEQIAELKDVRAAPHILRLLTREPRMHVPCIRTLQALGFKQAAPQIAALLGDQNPDVRLAAVRCLDAFDEPAFVKAVQPLHVDPDPEVRRTARALLARCKIPLPAETSAAEQAGAALDRLLCAVARSEGDDLILTGDRKPMIKRMGKTIPLTKGTLSPAQVRGLILPQLSAVQRDELDKKREIDFSYEVRSEGLRFRANVFLSLTGVSGVFRIIKGTVPSLDSLGLPPIVRTFGELKNGLVLVGGPTGSGKSTTLAALIDHINSTSSRHIISLEDPIEVIHHRKQSLVNQREIGVHARSFDSALRSTLREDPDVILVGEMRDLPTISFAVTAAETGHLVFGTIHTTSADTSVDRLINAFPAGQQEQVRTMLAQSLRAVLCQYLIKRSDGSGRAVASEVMINTDAVANLIRKGKTFQLPSIIATNRESGMQQMDSDLLRLFKEGKISGDEAYLKARDKKAFEEMMAGGPKKADSSQAPAGPGAHAAQTAAAQPGQAAALRGNPAAPAEPQGRIAPETPLPFSRRGLTVVHRPAKTGSTGGNKP
jgi:twitching motility protein PilT